MSTYSKNIVESSIAQASCPWPSASRFVLRSGGALFLALAMLMPASTAQDQSESSNSGDYRIRVTSDLVLTNVVVRDKQGNLVRGLSQDDFSILEDGKPQRITSFDFENVDALVTAGTTGPTVSGTAAPLRIIGTNQPVNKEELKNHRLIVLFFDFGGM